VSNVGGVLFVEEEVVEPIGFRDAEDSEVPGLPLEERQRHASAVVRLSGCPDRAGLILPSLLRFHIDDVVHAFENGDVRRRVDGLLEIDRHEAGDQDPVDWKSG